MKTCIVCDCRDSGSEGLPDALLQGAATTTLAFVLEEGVTAARDGLCGRHRTLVEAAREIARGMRQ
jgi:hypothetical protein